ncbi:MAG: ChaN family lipoprotein [Planctomycetales bacterium]|nr:ChaN family lipoprotein [bacterium]UNM09849.1 MAG: ChaN family lipoprotein [Planctomycetales bacterium]
MHTRLFLPAIAALLAAQAMTSPARADQPAGDDPLRIYALDEERSLFDSGIVSWERFISDLAAADVVFLGEYHDDDASHRVQLRVLDELAWRHDMQLSLAMEQFERDVQQVLDAYLRGEIDEEAFLADSRPWPNYPEHYRPLIEYCREYGIPVRAGNIPRRFASKVAKSSLPEMYGELTEEERPWVAGATVNEHNAYYDNFVNAMGGHGSGMSDETFAKFYEAQCIKDDTMAESIAMIRDAGPDRPVLHVNGSFHSDYGLGTVERLIQRRPADNVVVVALRPVDSFTGLMPFEDRELADYIVYVPGPQWGMWKKETMAREAAAAEAAAAEEAAAEEAMSNEE